MKELLLTLMILPLLSVAQDASHRFENDTLYTKSGYKIFKGHTIEFAKGLERWGRFKHVSVKNGLLSTSLTDCLVTVKGFKKYSVTELGTGYIIFDGYLKRKDGSTEYIVLQMAFDKAIENSPVLPSEIKVGDEFRNKYNRDKKRESVALRNMYEDKVITKKEYQEMKKKIDEQLPDQ